jgi:hypothetical protein
MLNPFAFNLVVNPFTFQLVNFHVYNEDCCRPNTVDVPESHGSWIPAAYGYSTHVLSNLIKANASASASGSYRCSVLLS